MLAAHAVAPINSAEDVARQLSRVLSKGPFNHLWVLTDLLHLVLSVHHLVNRIKSPGAVVSDEHGSTATVALGKHLRAAAASTMAIELANLLVAQVLVALGAAGTSQLVASI